MTKMTGPEQRIRANRTQGWRAVGGHLTCGPSVVHFEPHGLDRATGGASWVRPIEEVVDVGVAPAFRTGGLPFGGGIRARLRVVLADGTEELFVVGKASQVRDQIAALVDQAGGVGT
jgi:hypothetical protein